MPLLFGDYTYFLLIPAMILAAWAQFMVSSNYNKYADVYSKRGMTGADVARNLLSANGITDVEVQQIRGNLTDHYDPRSRVLKLSEGVYDSSSLSAISIAAHETGHAVQHANGYVPLTIRSAIVPVASFSSSAAVPVFILGMFLGNSGYFLMQVGIFLFLGAVIFQLISLPVEFNASKRAIAMLESGHYLDADEIQPAKKVLNSAALTYVAAAFMTIAQLLRLVLLSNRRKN